ncbi:MarR family winged helix-turn-helix transcriptional regulator [Chitinophaga tropicalis]|uniref:MarR family transcriptional regulator n=1 Tax=Chitinophaga tropicalis TaxID=2683588 RepID=A0A7K1UD65_9BACT|nr:MarR family transcriptional regulator [Chitinophaga tropicalis]MVT12312.1 MarR family transcriptional regulator [Chitinophaga tropicalis]
MKEPLMCSTVGYLLMRVCKVHRNKGNQMLAAYNLHAGQEQFLQEVMCNGAMTMNELKDNLEVTPATVTRMAERLEKNGFLTKEKCCADQRVVRVSLTEKGKEATSQIIDTTWNKLEQQMSKNMSMEEKILLKRLLMQVLDNLEEEE